MAEGNGSAGAAAAGAGVAAGLIGGPWGIALMGGMQLMQALSGAQAAEAEAMQARIMFDEQEFQRKWQTQIQNREIHRQNALKWFNNRKIAEVASKRRGEEEFYIRYNWDNATGAFGMNLKSTNDELFSRLRGKGMRADSGTARALLRMSNERAKETMSSLRIGVSNQLITAERRQQQALAGRDFGYNEHIPFMPGIFGGPSAEDAYQGALMSGIAGGIANTLGYAAQSYQGAPATAESTVHRDGMTDTEFFNRYTQPIPAGIPVYEDQSIPSGDYLT
jgi:hypothetical protein